MDICISCSSFSFHYWPPYELVTVHIVPEITFCPQYDV